MIMIWKDLYSKLYISDRICEMGCAGKIFYGISSNRKSYIQDLYIINVD